MSLAGIREYRWEVARTVRAERRGYGQPIGRDVDIDVSLFYGGVANATFAADGDDRDHHRRVACEAKAEIWQHIRAGDIDNDERGEAVQTFEEMSHTE